MNTPKAKTRVLIEWEAFSTVTPYNPEKKTSLVKCGGETWVYADNPEEALSKFRQAHPKVTLKYIRHEQEIESGSPKTGSKPKGRGERKRGSKNGNGAGEDPQKPATG
jgi:hypothetical protein